VTARPMSATDQVCARCGSPVRANAPFCNGCGQSVTHAGPPTPHSGPPTPPPTVAGSPQHAPSGTDGLVAAGREVRCCAYLLDLAALVSPALPITATAAIVGVVEVLTIVIPVAFVAGWFWMSLWQGYTGQTFGKAMLGVRSVRAGGTHAPGFLAVVLRGVLFAASVGLVALPVIASATPRAGWHDRASGLALIDITLGSNPYGARQQTALRQTIDRSLRKVSSPVPLGSSAAPYVTNGP
jgi:uncharacterized RDD family membrane protein YckC